MNDCRRQETGQAMTEFVISAAFVMVPLFLIVPTVGKYIDMQLATHQAARYGAWEYTVNYEDKNDLSSGFDGLRRRALPVKSLARVGKEALRRYYSDSRIAVDQAGYDAADANRLWIYYDGRKMIDPAPQQSPVQASGPGATADPVYISRGILGAVDSWAWTLSTLLGAVGVDARFNADNMRGRFAFQVNMPVTEAAAYTPLRVQNRKPLFLQPLKLHLQSRAAVLSDSWGAGNSGHALYQSRGLVPTALLDQPVIRTVQGIASILLMAPELNKGNLSFGYIAADEVNPERRPDDSRQTRCKGGYCEY